MLTLTLSILVVSLAGAITGYLLVLLLSAAAEPMENFWARQRFAARQQTARQSDELLKLGAWEAALRQLRESFFLEPIRQPALVSEAINHHAGILARILSVTNELYGESVRLLSVAKVDRLLNERGHIHRRYLRAYETLDAVRLRDLTQELECNRIELENALDQLFAEVRTLLHDRGNRRTHRGSAH